MGGIDDCNKVYFKKVISSTFSCFRFIDFYLKAFFAILRRITIKKSKHFYRTASLVYNYQYPTFTYRSSRRDVFCKKGVFLKILKNSQENNCVGVSFSIKLQVWGFAVQFAKLLKTLFLIEYLQWLLLYILILLCLKHFLNHQECYVSPSLLNIHLEFFLSIYCLHLWS